MIIEPIIKDREVLRKDITEKFTANIDAALYAKLRLRCVESDISTTRMIEFFISDLLEAVTESDIEHLKYKRNKKKVV